MKKVIIMAAIFLSFNTVYADDKVDAELEKCVDGDTAYFIIDGESQKVRFLAIDTPESTNTIEPYGKIASAYTCDLLTNANSIQIEMDPDSDDFDRYDRMLAWIWADGELVQEKILEMGYAEVAYLYGDYMYTNELEIVENQAKINQMGMWGEYEAPNYLLYYFLGLLASIVATAINYVYYSKNKLSGTISSILKRDHKLIPLIGYCLLIIPSLNDTIKILRKYGLKVKTIK